MPNGLHHILELYNCNRDLLDKQEYIIHVLTKGAEVAKSTLLNLATHKFEPHGVTGIALLAESHISIHTWPETGYAAVDIFTCGSHTEPEKAGDYLIMALGAKDYRILNIERG